MTADIQPAGSPHAEFLEWAVSQGVVINHVRPARIPNRGLGVVASRSIKAGTELIRVPTAALLTTNCIPKKFIDKHDADLTVHGLLASFLTNGSSSPKEMGKYHAWRNTWPTYDDFVECMPLLWPTELREQMSSSAGAGDFWPLPPSIGAPHGSWDYTKKPARNVAAESLICKQQRKLEADIEKTRAAFPDMDRSEFVRSWMVVNTRSFYYDRPLRRKPIVHEDKMILCPVIDYFNHSDDGCTVTFDYTGYFVVADRDYRAGEELYVSYGAHDNDLLLAEYGFLPAQNMFDCISLDAWVLAPSTGIEKTRAPRLQKAGYLDAYNIVAVDGQGEVCHRTQVAVRAATMKPNRWLQYVRGKPLTDDDEEACQFLCDRILQPFKQTVEASIKGLKAMDGDMKRNGHGKTENSELHQDFAHILPTLILRWEQIDKMIDQAIESLED